MGLIDGLWRAKLASRFGFQSRGGNNSPGAIAVGTDPSMNSYVWRLPRAYRIAAVPKKKLC